MFQLVSSLQIFQWSSSLNWSVIRIIVANTNRKYIFYEFVFEAQVISRKLRANRIDSTALYNNVGILGIPCWMLMYCEPPVCLRKFDLPITYLYRYTYLIYLYLHMKFIVYLSNLSFPKFEAIWGTISTFPMFVDSSQRAGYECYRTFKGYL